MVQGETVAPAAIVAAADVGVRIYPIRQPSFDIHVPRTRNLSGTYGVIPAGDVFAAAARSGHRRGPVEQRPLK